MGNVLNIDLAAFLAAGLLPTIVYADLKLKLITLYVVGPLSKTFALIVYADRFELELYAPSDLDDSDPTPIALEADELSAVIDAIKSYVD